VKDSSRRFRHRVTVESQVESIDSNGDHFRAWEYVTTVWAEIKPLSGRELLLAQQVQSQVSTNIVTRYRSDIDATCRLKHNGTTFNVLAVIRDPQSGLEWLTLQCSSGTNDG
jgi:SPP1 family predicted phage head-tail adaptor